jgi:hypothetical protein
MATSGKTMRERLRRVSEDAVRRAAGRLGYDLAPQGGYELVDPNTHELIPKGRYDLVQRDFYSPVPDLGRLPEGIWERRSALGGIDLGIDRAIELVETELAPFVAEFDVPAAGPLPPGEFFLGNGNYEAVDAELLYALLRARKPKLVVELGSGYTTLLIGLAARRNAEDGTATEHLAYDPYPRAQIFGEAPPPPTRFEPVPATEVPLEDFDRLGAGDILFVDTTHTVKLGSDVNFIVLDVLPRLAPGVIVHFHDIFLPFEYPRTWFEDMQYYWAEQYLVQAFLAFNDAFEVLLPAQALAREQPQRLGAAVPSFSPGVSPGALWLIRR